MQLPTPTESRCWSLARRWSRHDRSAYLGDTTEPLTANSSLWRLRGSEFEQRVAPSFGEVILRGVVDAYAVSA
jgi:hypothetical protein